MTATPLNSLNRRMGVAAGATETMPFDKPATVQYAVQYATSLGLGQLPEDGNSSKLLEWFAA